MIQIYIISLYKSIIQKYLFIFTKKKKRNDDDEKRTNRNKFIYEINSSNLISLYGSYKEEKYKIQKDEMN